MEIQPYFQSLLDSLRSSANVKTIFGDPISAESRTIIPVARVGYGFGSGFGEGGVPQRANQSEAGRQPFGQGAGGGGGIGVVPVGVIEISTQGTRFIPISSRRKLALAAALGVLLGVVLSRRRSR